MKKLIGTIIALALLTVSVFGTVVFADDGNTKTVAIKDGSNAINVKSYYLYYSYKATKSGRMTMTFSEDPGPITVYNAKGNTISERVFGTGKGDARTYVWSVKKGETYKFYMWYHTEGVRKYTVKLSTKKITEPKTKKKKATNLKFNKTKTGMVANGQSKASWFKIKFKKAKKANFTFKGKAIQGSLLITFYKGKKKITQTKIAKDSKMKLYSAAISGSVNSKISKGTYYIKIERWKTTSAGDFTVKVK